MLQFSGVCKAFLDRDKGKGMVALREVDLTVAEEELVCLVGPSGCGKSTLLNLAAGFDRPTRGSVTLNGLEVERPSPRIGMVFQDPSLFPWLSVLENVALGLRVQGVGRREREERAREMLRLVDLESFERSRPSDLSGGMKQKVAIARTLALDPDILLMDEPFGALDEQARKHMDLELLKIWQRERKTVVFVTHNIEESIVLGSRIVLMGTRPGRVFREWKVDIPRPREIFGKDASTLRQEISGALQQVLSDCGCKRSEVYQPTIIGEIKEESGWRGDKGSSSCR